MVYQRLADGAEGAGCHLLGDVLVEFFAALGPVPTLDLYRCRDAVGMGADEGDDVVSLGAAAKAQDYVVDTGSIH